jgi:hypothetical protein
MSNQQLDDAFNSMLRTDSIPLKDIGKLNLLANYYVDYYGFLNQICFLLRHDTAWSKI